MHSVSLAVRTSWRIFLLQDPPSLLTNAGGVFRAVLRIGSVLQEVMKGNVLGLFPRKKNLHQKYKKEYNLVQYGTISETLSFFFIYVGHKNSPLTFEILLNITENDYM